MKKIISGKVYDTARAKEIGSNTYGEGGLHQITETLYRKRTGEYFIHGEGGAATRYASPCGDVGWWASGEKIIPLTYEDTLAWAEANLSADAYMAEFGVIEETGNNVTTSLSLAEDVYSAAKRAAAKRGCSLSAYVESLIRAE